SPFPLFFTLLHFPFAKTKSYIFPFEFVHSLAPPSLSKNTTSTNSTMVVNMNEKVSTSAEQRVNQTKLPLKQRVKQYFDLYESNKRRIPNASDPLHNR
ncbi:hypothetical protein Leryth_005369, partial [Lithospermum erythrorhizon]